MKLAIGIDLGGTNLKGAAVDPDGVVVTKYERPILQTEPDVVIGDMVDLVSQLLDAASTNVTSLVGVGVGSPGPLSPQKGLIYRAANLPGWKDVALIDELSARLNTRVFLDNDGNVAALGEQWAGAGKGMDDLVMLTLGTGVGAGVILNGRILHGHFENAAELGHTIVEPDGLPCSCGQRGCLEQYASASGVARRATERCGAQLTCEDVVIRAKDGELDCRAIWSDACKFLAITCINIQHAFNPQCVVLGGGMSKAGEFLLDQVSQFVTDQKWSLFDDVPQLRLAQLGHMAGAVGAAGLIWRSTPD